MTIHETHSPEWHDERASGIGGSDIAALLGLSRYASPFSLWAEKTGLLPPDPALEQSERLQFGRDMESVLATMFHRRTGLYVAGEQMMVRSADHPFARATLDGLVVESPDSDLADALGTVQFKTWGTFGWPDGVPPAIRAQTIWEAGVAGFRGCWVAVLFAGFRFEVFEIPWDDVAQRDWEFMLERATAFWNNHVVPEIAPDIDDSEATAVALDRAYPVAPGVQHVADARLRSALDRYDALKARVRDDEKKLDELKNTIAEAVKEADEITLADGTPIWTYHQQSRSGIDAKALRAAHPDIADEFGTTTKFRVLRKKESKK